jgi:hypothetical protein
MKSEQLCCICDGLIEPLMSNDIPPEIIWDKGHNAEPVKDGQCCDKCNFEKVLPERLKYLHHQRVVNERLRKINR